MRFFEKGVADRRKRKRKPQKLFEKRFKPKLTKSQRAALAKEQYARRFGNHDYCPDVPSAPIILGHHNPPSPPFTPTPTSTPTTTNTTLLSSITLDDMFQYIGNRTIDHANLRNLSPFPIS